MTPDAVTAAADELAGKYLAHPAAVGLVVGVLAGGERRVFGYGRVRREDDRRPDGDTVYEIASVTKVFTAVLLAEMAHRGEVRLDQPAGELLPPGVTAPTYRGEPFTLAQLSEHTSALPRLPVNLQATVTDEANPYKDYQAHHLYEYLSAARLPFPPGSGEMYSNLGTGLLGHLLGLRAGQPFEGLVAEWVLRPLGMADTAVSLSADQAARMAPGHDEAGKPTSNWDTPALGGAGALRSTVNELLTFLQANLDPAATPLAAALEECQRPRPVRWWRRVPVGLPVALALAAGSLLVQWAVPVPPGSTKFLALFLLPLFVALVWKGFWAAVWAGVAVWLGCLLVWGHWFGGRPAATGLAVVLGLAGLWAGYLPPPRRARLGWQAAGPVLWHNGGTGGYASFVGFDRRRRVAVAVLANTARGVDAIGFGLLDRLPAGPPEGKGT